METKQDLQANPGYAINYLSQEVARLVQENSMLKAYIQEQKEKESPSIPNPDK